MLMCWYERHAFKAQKTIVLFAHHTSCPTGSMKKLDQIGKVLEFFLDVPTFPGFLLLLYLKLSPLSQYLFLYLCLPL